MANKFCDCETLDEHGKPVPAFPEMDGRPVCGNVLCFNRWQEHIRAEERAAAEEHE